MFDTPTPEMMAKKNIFELERCKLSELEIFELQSNEKEFSVKDSIDIEYMGEVVRLDASRIRSGKKEAYCVGISKNDKIVLSLKFDYAYLDAMPVIHSTMLKSFESKDDLKLRGLGMKVFKLTLDFFQDLANMQNKSFLHEIVKSPLFDIREDPENGGDFSDASLMTDAEKSIKWDEIFVEFLTKDNYEKNQIEDGDEYWRKEYLPQQK